MLKTDDVIALRPQLEKREVKLRWTIESRSEQFTWRLLVILFLYRDPMFSHPWTMPSHADPLVFQALDYKDHAWEEKVKQRRKLWNQHLSSDKTKWGKNSWYSYNFSKFIIFNSEVEQRNLIRAVKVTNYLAWRLATKK